MPLIKSAKTATLSISLMGERPTKEGGTPNPITTSIHGAGGKQRVHVVL
jgi:hypothetical protein